MSTVWSEQSPAPDYRREPEEATESWTTPFAGEKVGKDDSRVLIEDTTAVPWRWICALDVTFDKPYPKGWPTGFGRGSGLLVGPQEVLTAAHNVYADDSTSPKSVYVTPGRNGRDDPFGRVKATARSVVASAFGKNGINPEFDFAILTLERAIAYDKFEALGNKPLGYWGSTKWGHGTKMKALDIKFLTGKRVTVAGYPGDRCGTKWFDPKDKTESCPKADHGTTLWSGAGTLSPMPHAAGRFLHTVDTYEGQSGSPVWMKIKNGERWLVGVHIDRYRLVVNDLYTHNVAVHLSERNLTAVRGWIKGPLS
jgi:V8-like Glu-specific endopeptidase